MEKRTQKENGTTKPSEKTRNCTQMNSLMEDIQQEKFGAGLAALNNTATKVPINDHKAIRNLLHFRDGRLSEKVLTNNEVIEGVHWQRGGPMITMSLCRRCCAPGQQKHDVGAASSSWETVGMTQERTVGRCRTQCVCTRLWKHIAMCKNRRPFDGWFWKR